MKRDDRVTFVQEVQTPGCIGVTNAQHGNLLSFKCLDSISAPSDRGEQSVVSPRLSLGLRRPRLQNDKRQGGLDARVWLYETL